jgi:hypothetical protein
MKYIVDTREGNTAERVPGDVVPGVIVAGEGDAGAGGTLIVLVVLPT